MGGAAARFTVAFRAGDRGQTALRRLDDLADGIVCGGSGKGIAAGLSALAFEQTRAAEGGDDGFKVLHGDLLPGSNIVEGEVPLVFVFRDVEHDAQSVPPLRGDHHNRSLPSFSVCSVSFSRSRTTSPAMR